MVVEMCGLPGCGKSTLIEKCFPNPQIVYNRRKIFRDVRIRSQIFKVIPHSFPMKNEYIILRDFANEYPNANKVFISKMYRLNYALNVSKAKLVLLDEGPIQHITSIAFDEEIKNDELLNEAVSVLSKDEVMVFYCRCPIDVTIGRLIERKENGYMNNGRYEVNDLSRLRKLLEIKDLNISTVLSRYNGKIIELNMQDSIDKNIEIIKDNIEKTTFIEREKLWL